jgi:hypothetical protein
VIATARRCAGWLGIATLFALALGVAGSASPAAAHNPIFAPGPHVAYQGGVEVSLGYSKARAGAETEQELEISAEYGLTADWTVEFEVPFVDKAEDGKSRTGLGDMALRSRFRFWRLDAPGAQTSAALLAQLKLPTGDADGDPRLGSGSTDILGGLLFGHEGRRTYFNAAARYRYNTEGEGGLRKGDRQFLDLVVGVRPVLSGYLEPDTVLFLELNWENAGRDRRNGAEVQNTGGWELFLSPGVFWTWRNVAIRAGAQVPMAGNLDGTNPDSDYRLKLELKYQF